MSSPKRAEDIPSCWLRLEEGPDEGGAPLVRDCSCRGTSGFAHLSCIVKYAESAGKRLYEREGPSACMDPFNICPNCKQYYQNDVHKALAKACVDFVEEGFKDEKNFLPHKHLYAHALMTQMVMLDGKNEGEKAGGEEIIAKFISVMEEMKSQLEQLEQLKQLESLDWGTCLRLRDDLTDLEANGNANIGHFYRRLNSNEGLFKAKEQFEKARDLFKTMHTMEAETSLAKMKQNISELESELSGNEVHDEELDVIYLQRDYHRCLGIYGQSSSATIYAGVALAKALLDERRTIEAEKLLSNLVDISRRTHGHEHRSTKSVLSVLTSARERKVVIRFEGFSGWFQALRYENEGEDCVVQGPIAFESNVDEEEQCSFDSTDIIPFPGTPVICHGLQKAAHLNGKIGDVRDLDVKEKEDGSKYFDKDIDRCVVHFKIRLRA
ncbi:hypothetical protein QTG54_009039 [Skeletonema marinoi]|uniref:RING-CH-type domain-containing protein n=1 Tax=Skeletonema marinoi TaxID=267567 RepID=A0AAD8Y6U1_9STRA|nr:hypothetical protein QTG54_009039 [Skeletonema marinoi]